MKWLLCFAVILSITQLFGCGGGGGKTIDTPPISVPLSPPADGTIKFLIIQDTSRDLLISMKPDGTGLKTVNIQNGFNFAPSPSMELYVVSCLGVGNVLDQNDTLIKTIPNFTPDYSWESEESLLVSSEFDRIYRQHLTGATETLIDSPIDELYHNPVASPDQTKIAYLHHRWGNCCDIFVMDHDGSNKRIVAQYATGFNRDLKLHWQDDNTLVYLVDYNPFPDHGYKSSQPGIHVLNIDTKIHKVVRKVGDYDYFDFTLSPDRTKIALAVEGKMYVAQTSNWNFAKIPPNISGIYDFCFSPTSQEIAMGVDNSFFSGHNTTPGLWIYRLGDTDAELAYALKTNESSPNVIWVK